MVLSPELTQVSKPKDTVDAVNLKESTNEYLKQTADDIVKSLDNQEQVKTFPELWNYLNDEEKAEFASMLTVEIKDAIAELNGVGIEYSSEISQKDIDDVKALEFVKKNHDRIPQSWVKLVDKANEVAKDIGKEIKDKGVLDVSNMP